MKDTSPKDFCAQFKPCPEGQQFAMEYDSMYYCYEGLLKGEADHHSFEWAWWTLLRVQYGREVYTKDVQSMCTRLLQISRTLVGDEKVDEVEEYVRKLSADPYAARPAWLGCCNVLWYKGALLDTAIQEAEVALYRYTTKFTYGQGMSYLRACALKALADKYPDGIVCDVRSAWEDENEIVLSTPGTPNPYAETFITPKVQEPLLAMLREIGNPFKEEV